MPRCLSAFEAGAASAITGMSFGCVAAGDRGNQFRQYHRYPGAHPVTSIVQCSRASRVRSLREPAPPPWTRTPR